MDARIIPAVAGFSMVIAACAQTEPAVAADRYQIDASHTFVQYSVQRFGFNDMLGIFPGVEGVITLDQENPAASTVEVTIDTTTMDAADEERNNAVHGEFWLNTAAFPKMTFTSTSVEVTGENTANVTGDLTLMGITKSITLDVTLNKIGMEPSTRDEAVGISATANLSRLDFGIETAANFVGTDVEIRIEALGNIIRE